MSIEANIRLPCREGLSASLDYYNFFSRSGSRAADDVGRVGGVSHLPFVKAVR